jgi:16S rRNA G966 N2-methylase RsmD
MDLLTRTLDLLGDADRRWLNDDATVVAKHFWKDDLPATAGVLTKVRQKRFGETMLSFYTRAR